jgi:hypothetical protein
MSLSSAIRMIGCPPSLVALVAAIPHPDPQSS